MKEARPRFTQSLRINRVLRASLSADTIALVVLVISAPSLVAWAIFSALPKIFGDIQKSVLPDGVTREVALEQISTFTWGFIATLIAVVALLIAMVGVALDFRGRHRALHLEAMKLREYPECVLRVEPNGLSTVTLRHENKEPLYVRILIKWRQPRRRRFLGLTVIYEGFPKKIVGFVSLPQVIGAEPGVMQIPLVSLQLLKNSTSKIWFRVEVSRDNDSILAQSRQTVFNGSFKELQALATPRRRSNKILARKR